MKLGIIIIYTKQLEAVAAFYCTHFGFEQLWLDDDRIVELVPQDGGAHILLHPMPVGRKEGQALVKLVFDVEDIDAFCRVSKERGLAFGPIHHADGYSFANAKTPHKTLSRFQAGRL